MRRFHLSAHLGYLFTDVALTDRFGAAARCGFRHVEHPSPYELAAAEVADLCERHNLRMAQIALPMGGAGQKGLAAIPGREHDFARSAEIAIAYARRIGCRQIHPMSGVPANDLPVEKIAATYLANLELVCGMAASEAIDVIVEPIGASGVPGYYLNHPTMAVGIIEQAAQPNLRLSFDIYHAVGVELDPSDFVSKHGPLLAHVQIADAPGRHEPGTGAIDFRLFFEALATADYEGVIGLEYHPVAETKSGLTWSSTFERIRLLKRAP
ncbi:hydroxypyruvate isomerase family protein [Parablastomonas sp. CN1-191]|uniref:hydroxypyruvate isomerase family protein n=1 Tax=Parablastomonas sp. CN1-191 TaxID=3400908 RepID=UPI003BF81645